MKKLAAVGIFFLSFLTAKAQDIKFDEFDTDQGKLRCYFLGHGSIYMDWNGFVIYVDPVSDYADYTKLPKADLVLITHDHGDHFDQKVLQVIEKESTKWIMNSSSQAKWGKGEALKNGDNRKIGQFVIEAVEAYNTNNTQYHPKDRDNGYVVSSDKFKVYVAGDCEDMPELAQRKNINVAFLPVNQPFTMTPEQAIKAAKMVSPKVLYPYHFSNTDLTPLVEGLKGTSIDVRIRDLK